MPLSGPRRASPRQPRARYRQQHHTSDDAYRPPQSHGTRAFIQLPGHQHNRHHRLNRGEDPCLRWRQPTRPQPHRVEPGGRRADCASPVWRANLLSARDGHECGETRGWTRKIPGARTDRHQTSCGHVNECRSSSISIPVSGSLNQIAALIGPRRLAPRRTVTTPEPRVSKISRWRSRYPCPSRPRGRPRAEPRSRPARRCQRT